jgi:23S rRNA (pseudouridine1915-N3)-methyltransferase
MKFRFVWVGKTRNKHCLALLDEYLRRLDHFVKFEITEVRDAAGANARIDEGKRIFEKLNQSSFVCLLDVGGRGISSHELADEIEKWQNDSIKEVAFVIGGAEGVSSEVAERADSTLSLSFLTFTHEMARVLLVEQLYRAYTILRGFPYQK